MSQQIVKKTKQIRISTELHKLLKVEAAEAGKSIKTVLEEKLDFVPPTPTCEASEEGSDE
ncbi:MAG: toxin-antitoxin system HicB family antitoxin [Patescibacteria group bacterium]